MYTQKEADMAAGMGSYVLQSPDAALTDVDMDRQQSSGKDCSVVK